MTETVAPLLSLNFERTSPNLLMLLKILQILFSHVSVNSLTDQYLSALVGRSWQSLLVSLQIEHHAPVIDRA
jgi:hypothetical protein